MPFPDVPRCYRCSMVPTLATTSCRTPSRTSTVSAHRRGPGRPAGGVLHTVTEVIRMIEILQPTSEPGWVLDHEGYSVLTENAVESRFAFGNGFLGIRQASERRSQQEGTSSFLGSPLVCPKTPQRRVLSG